MWCTVYCLYSEEYGAQCIACTISGKVILKMSSVWEYLSQTPIITLKWLLMRAENSFSEIKKKLSIVQLVLLQGRQNQGVVLQCRHVSENEEKNRL